MRWPSGTRPRTCASTPKDNPEPDPELRDYENVPLKEDVTAYMRREVLPHVPDAWVDESKTKVGYEINFNRYFYKYQPPRPLDEIEGNLKKIEAEIAAMLAEVTEEEQTEETAEHVDISAQLDELRLMKNGWLEGEGLAPSHEGLDWLSRVFDDHYPENLPLPVPVSDRRGGRPGGVVARSERSLTGNRTQQPFRRMACARHGDECRVRANIEHQRCGRLEMVG